MMMMKENNTKFKSGLITKQELTQSYMGMPAVLFHVPQIAPFSA